MSKNNMLIWGGAILIIIVLLYIINRSLDREDFKNPICKIPTPYLDSITNSKKPSCVKTCPVSTAPYLDRITNSQKPSCVNTCPVSTAPYLDTTANPPKCDVCPSDKPFWNTAANLPKCDVCPSDKPFWNKTATPPKCDVCPKNTPDWISSINECKIGDTYCDFISIKGDYKMYDERTKECIGVKNTNILKGNIEGNPAYNTISAELCDKKCGPYSRPNAWSLIPVTNLKGSGSTTTLCEGGGGNLVSNFYCSYFGD